MSSCQFLSRGTPKVQKHINVDDKNHIPLVLILHGINLKWIWIPLLNHNSINLIFLQFFRNVNASFVATFMNFLRDLSLRAIIWVKFRINQKKMQKRSSYKVIGTRLWCLFWQLLVNIRERASLSLEVKNLICSDFTTKLESLDLTNMFIEGSLSFKYDSESNFCYSAIILASTVGDDSISPIKSPILFVFSLNVFAFYQSIVSKNCKNRVT